MPLFTQPKTVLILDLDLGRQFWLAQVLVNEGYRVLPARSTEEAVILIKDYGLTIAALVVDLNVDGAAAFLRRLRTQQTQVRVIASVESSTELDEVLNDIDAVRFTPSAISDLDGLKEEWLATFHALLCDAGT